MGKSVGVMMQSGVDEAFNTMLGLSIFAWFVGSWFTHIFFCFKVGSWGFLIAGALFFPIGVLHGTWLWMQ